MATSAYQSRYVESPIDNILSPDLPKQWDRGRVIGKGGFGTVYLVLDKKNPNQERFVVKDIFVTEKDKVEITKQFKTETTILRTSETHPRIVRFFGYCQTDNTFSIFLQYLKNGSLTDYLHKIGKLLEPKIQLFTRQILEAVVFLHDNNIIHRDIKGRNILLEDEENIKLTDFGISKILKDVTSTGTAIGTYRWIAPEVVTADNLTQKYNKKADIWSIGCTVVEMITGKDPYPEFTNEQVILKIGHNKIPPGYSTVSANCETFLKKTFTVDPLERPTAKDLLDTDQFINYGQTADKLRRVDEFKLVITDYCQKHPGHKEFVPVNMFDSSLLPTSCQDNELFELIKAISELTVLVKVRFISYSRPEDCNYGEASVASFSGSDFLRNGTGMIDFEMYNPTDNCTCSKCELLHPSDIRSSFTFNVITATHVVYDDEEAETAECTLFFNGDKSNCETVQCLRVANRDVKTDRCVLKCISHDITLIERLSKAWERYKDLNKIVTGRYKHQMEKNKLCVIVSHPHGATKCVTVGEWLRRETCGNVPQLNIPFTRYHYNTAACKGSSGAPVFILGSGSGMYHHTHYGGVVNDNYSGLFFD